MTKIEEYEVKLLEWLRRRGHSDFSQEEDETRINELNLLWEEALQENQSLFERWRR